MIAALERMGDEWTKCQRRRETRSKGGARHCHRGRGGEVGRGGRDSAWGGGSRKRSEGVARPEFPAGDGVVGQCGLGVLHGQARLGEEFVAAGCWWPGSDESGGRDGMPSLSWPVDRFHPAFLIAIRAGPIV